MTGRAIIHPVILSGGSGTRLWPLSRAALPKQLLALNGDRTMIQETALRLPDAAAPLLICNDDHRFLIAEQMRQIGVAPAGIVLEPVGRNTAAAATAAALCLSRQDPQALLLLLPSDHVIQDVEAFRRAVAVAADAAAQGYIVTFGITPTGPATGYGYIRQSAVSVGTGGVLKLDGFVEKPARADAQHYVDSGLYTWNSGMFVFRADILLREVERHAFAVLDHTRQAVDKSAHDLNFIRLDADSFAAGPNISLDYAVMEHTTQAAVLPCDFGWNDVGSWSSLWDIQPHDAQGNVLSGDVLSHETENCYVRSEARLTATVGVRDLIIVSTKDAVLVADKGHTQDVKILLETLKSTGRSEATEHSVIFRPWGNYETIDRGERFLVNRISVNPGGRVSLQMHHHRAEHWIVVQGTARVTCGESVTILHENESTFIPLGEKHRLENPGKIPLSLIEVQSGPYLGADDIVRYEDAYPKPA